MGRNFGRDGAIMIKDLSAEYVRSLLSYDEKGGVLRWKQRPGARIQWNARYAGKEAGCVRDDGYVIVGIDGTIYFAHRLIWLIVTGEWPIQIDHRDVNPSNNKWDNLRMATHTQNMANVRTRSASGFKGVYLTRNKTNPWMALITINKKAKNLGYFSDPEEAHAAYCAAAKQHHGAYSRAA